MADVRIVDFNQLPSTVRQRLIACFRGQAPPFPILAETGFWWPVIGWICLILLAGVTELVAIAAGFGSATDDAIHPWWVIGIHVVGLLLLMGGVLSLIRRFLLRKALPFSSGRYVFAGDFVDARTAKLRIVPLSTLRDFQAVHHYHNGVYTNTSMTFHFEKGKETFTLRGRELADNTLQALQIAQSRLNDAVRSQNPAMISQLDPFFEVRINDGWDRLQAAPQRWDGISAQPTPEWMEKRWLIAFGCALVLAPTVWFVRNRLSDDAMFAEVKRADSVFLYKKYLAQQGRHSAEVKAALPKAALREARTVTELRAVMREYRNHPVEKEAETRIHELYAKTTEEFRRKASTEDPNMLPFMERLLKYLEDHDSPSVQVRFRRPTSASLQEADKELQAELSKKGQQFAPISPHFKDENSSERENLIVEKLDRAFSSIFPRDVLHLESGRNIGETSPSPEDLTAPTIEILYIVAPSGEVYVSEKDKRSFVGILVGFDMWMRVPKAPDAFNFKLKVEPPRHFTVYENSYSSRTSGSPSDSRVYDVMAENAFNEFSTKLHRVFFRDAGKDDGKETDGN